MPTWSISHAHLQLRPDDINRRHYLVKMKAGSEYTGVGTPGTEGATGNCCGGGSQYQQGAEELVWGGTAAAAETASPPHTGEKQHQPGTEELVWRRAATAAGAAAIASRSDWLRSELEGLAERRVAASARAAEGTHNRDRRRRDTKLKRALAGAEENPDWGGSTGPSQGDVPA